MLIQQGEELTLYIGLTPPKLARMHEWVIWASRIYKLLDLNIWVRPNIDKIATLRPVVCGLQLVVGAFHCMCMWDATNLQYMNEIYDNL
jgi:hypothetical protein